MALNKKAVADPTAELKIGRTPEQCSAIDYFYSVMGAGGCMKGAKAVMSDSDYVRLVNSKLASIDFTQRALDKLGLDIEQVQEVPPVTFSGYVYGDDKALVKYGKDKKWRSSAYQITKVFFSDTEVYFYQYRFNSLNNEIVELVDEYFYKDITNFYVTDKIEEHKVVEEAGGCMPKKGTTGGIYYATVKYSTFSIVVPGSSRSCTMVVGPDTEATIKGMTAKLREKKAE